MARPDVPDIEKAEDANHVLVCAAYAASELQRDVLLMERIQASQMLAGAVCAGCSIAASSDFQLDAMRPEVSIDARREAKGQRDRRAQ